MSVNLNENHFQLKGAFVNCKSNGVCIGAMKDGQVIVSTRGYKSVAYEPERLPVVDMVRMAYTIGDLEPDTVSAYDDADSEYVSLTYRFGLYRILVEYTGGKLRAYISGNYIEFKNFLQLVELIRDLRNSNRYYAQVVTGGSKMTFAYDFLNNDMVCYPEVLCNAEVALRLANTDNGTAPVCRLTERAVSLTWLYFGQVICLSVDGKRNVYVNSHHDPDLRIEDALNGKYSDVEIKSRFLTLEGGCVYLKLPSGNWLKVGTYVTESDSTTSLRITNHSGVNSFLTKKENSQLAELVISRYYGGSFKVDYSPDCYTVKDGKGCMLIVKRGGYVATFKGQINLSTNDGLNGGYVSELFFRLSRDD